MRRTVALLLAIASQAVAQVPVTNFAAPSAELSAEFTAIGSVTELRDGKVLVIDSQDDRLYLADFATHSARVIGRNGEGPKEYRRASRLMKAGGDTVLVRAASRYLFYTPKDGLLDRVINDRQLLMMQPAAHDPAGRLYFQGPLMNIVQRQSYDSIPIYRVDRRTLKGDTVAWLRSGTDEEVEVRRAGGNMGVRLARNPYRWLDTWGAFDDGTVIIARARDYRVDVISPDGKVTSTAPNAFPRLVVPKDEREKNPDFPEFKPPFVYGPSAADRTSPKGHFWVRRSTANIADAIEYDVIRRDGKICGRVKMPPRTDLIGFSDAWVYTAREDADGLAYLQRRAYPSCL